MRIEWLNDEHSRAYVVMRRFPWLWRSRAVVYRASSYWRWEVPDPESPSGFTLVPDWLDNLLEVAATVARSPRPRRWERVPSAPLPEARLLLNKK